jgi:hypothetical protein
VHQQRLPLGQHGREVVKAAGALAAAGARAEVGVVLIGAALARHFCCRRVAAARCVHIGPDPCVVWGGRCDIRAMSAAFGVGEFGLPGLAGELVGLQLPSPLLARASPFRPFAALCVRERIKLNAPIRLTPRPKRHYFPLLVVQAAGLRTRDTCSSPYEPS